MNEFAEKKVTLTWTEPKKHYDVVIVGGGGHGLAAAYYLATRHGITDVAVLERNYIGGGNSGRNTTIIRANYGIPEAVKFYKRSVELYQSLEAETDRWIMHKTKGILWVAHTEAGLRAERARAQVNQAFGANTEFIDGEQVKKLAPQADISGGGRWPIVGGSYHHEGASARHDRVVWAYAEGAMRAGAHVHQHIGVTGIRQAGGRVTGVDTTAGFIGARVVMSAVGGHVTRLGEMAGIRLPIRTHQLQAYVTNHYAQTFHPIFSSIDLMFYVSQTARGEMLIGAEVEKQPTYSYRADNHLLQTCSHRAITLLPFLRDLRILRQWSGVCDMTPDYSPVMSTTPLDGFVITTGWGTWGFKAIPASGEQMAELIATGRTPALIAPFALDRFARDRTLADRGSAGTTQ
jgi:sarcosine oxidase, subunit beta